MDPITVPEDLEPLSDDQLEELRQGLAARVAELADADDTEENTSELEHLAEQGTRITTAQTERTAQADERAERRQRAVEAFAPPEEAGETDPGEGEGEGEGEGAGEAGETDPAEGEGEGAPAGEQEEEAPVAAAATVTPRPGSAAGLGRRSPSAVKPKAGAGLQLAEGPVLQATGYAPGLKAGALITDPLQLAQSIVDAHSRFGIIPRGVVDPISVASAAKIMGGASVGADPMANFATLEQVRTAQDPVALVASGPFCTPQTPLYEFFRVAEAQSPVESDVTALQAPRGGVRFIVPPDVADAAGAIGITDEADIDPDDDSTWKPCIRVDCPAIDEEFVTAVSQCVTFGLLNYKTFPEQVAAFMEDVAVQFVAKKEVFYLDYIDGHSTAVSGVNTGYGALRQHMYNLTLEAVSYRKRRLMKRGATLKVYEPDWLLDVMKLDLLLDAHAGVDNMAGAEAKVLAAYRDQGLQPVWYNDSATGRNQKFANAQSTGNINRFPTTAQSYIFAPGTFARLDGGSYDAGLVRDATLNRTNDVQLFMEEWIGMVMLGLESVRLVDRGICATGGAPDYASLLTCA